MHGAIEAEDGSLQTLPWPGASSQYISVMVAEDVITASAGPGLTSHMGRRRYRLGSVALEKDVDEIVRGWSAVSALTAGVSKYTLIPYMIYH